MCGIAGMLDGRASVAARELVHRAQAMAAALTHRGPDDNGVWCDESAGIALAHRRLSILDLSPLGRQPMASKDNRFTLCFNGEIYNVDELRTELTTAGHVFRGRSDTEVMLAAMLEWGVAEAVVRFVGMFAFAVWDSQARKLWLARDRMGEKPLYYGVQDGALVFGSELKALRMHPAFAAEIDREALVGYLAHGCIQGPASIHRGIHKLPPGCLLEVDPGRLPYINAPCAYWSHDSAARAGLADPFRGGAGAAVDEAERLLVRAVRQQMLADVPVGAFLSGGIDSTVIVTLMQSMSAKPVRTFTIGFHERDYDEAGHARAVAAHLGTEHVEMYVTPEQAMDIIPMLPSLYDEPFADSSQIPTFLVSRLARTQVAVSLSGDGGDELFGGYSRYFQGRRLWRRLGWMPGRLRGMAASAIRGMSPRTWDAVGHLLPARLRPVAIGDRAHKFASLLSAVNADDVYTKLASTWSEPERLVLDCHPKTGLEQEQGARTDFTERMMLIDQKTYLPDDILVKVDRAAMGVGLETRVPFLDHRLVEFSWRLPLDVKIRGGQGKWILRQIMDRRVPSSLTDRPKMGFGVPIGAWLRGPLRDWAEDLLEPARLKNEGFFDPQPIGALWQEHLTGRRNWQAHLWAVLMFQAWLGSLSSGKAARP